MGNPNSRILARVVCLVELSTQYRHNIDTITTKGKMMDEELDEAVGMLIAAMAILLGRMPTVDEVMEVIKDDVS